MKKLILFSLIACMGALTFTGCKKGTEDPFITIKSRDGRLTHKWKLKSITGTEVDVTVFGSSTTTETTTTSYDGTTLTESTVTVSGSMSNTSNSTTTGTFEITFDKNGKQSYTVTYTSGSTTTTKTAEGEWFWLNTNKNRDHISIEADGTILMSGVYYIERLAGKEMILHNVTKSTSSTGSNSSSDIKYTFEKD